MLNWEEFPKVESDFMNHDHKECIELIQGLLSQCDKHTENAVDDDALLDGVQELKQHLVEHFQREEEAMQATQFPPYYVHKTEHDSVLQELDMVLKRWQADKNTETLKRYVERNMQNWLETHALTMDTVTAAHIAKNS